MLKNEMSIFERQEFENYIIQHPTIKKTTVGDLKFKLIYNPVQGNLDGLLSNPQFINTSIGKLEVDEYIEFYLNGNLKQCHLKNPIWINSSVGKIHIKETIGFNDNKQFRSGWLVNNQTIFINNQLLNVKESISFWNNGKIKKIILNEEWHINAIKYFAGNEVWFDQKGKLLN